MPSNRPAKKTPVDSLPDLIVEIISPATVRKDRLDKLNSYEQAQVPHYWLIDPLNRLIECYKLRNDGYIAFTRFGEGEFSHPDFPD